MDEHAQLDRLRHHTAQTMDAVLHTYKAHYRVARVYARLGTLLDVAVVVLTGLLTVALLWDRLPDAWLVTIAIAASVTSVLDTAMGFDREAREHTAAADEFHALFDDMRDFFVLDLMDAEGDHDAEQLRERFDALADRRQTLNAHMPNPTDWGYRRVDTERVRDSVVVEYEEWLDLDDLPEEARVADRPEGTDGSNHREEPDGSTPTTT